jgi:hypothetical protein
VDISSVAAIAVDDPAVVGVPAVDGVPDLALLLVFLTLLASLLLLTSLQLLLWALSVAGITVLTDFRLMLLAFSCLWLLCCWRPCSCWHYVISSQKADRLIYRAV